MNRALVTCGTESHTLIYMHLESQRKIRQNGTEKVSANFFKMTAHKSRKLTRFRQRGLKPTNQTNIKTEAHHSKTAENQR